MEAARDPKQHPKRRYCARKPAQSQFLSQVQNNTHTIQTLILGMIHTAFSMGSITLHCSQVRLGGVVCANGCYNLESKPSSGATP